MPGQIAGLAWKPATAPNTAAGALRDLQAWQWDSRIDFDALDWWWRLRMPAGSVPSGRVVLGFDGLATLADVWLDGTHVLHGESMFLAHELPLELDDGPHELLIRCAALAPELAKKRPRPRWRVPMLTHAQLRWFRTSLLGRTPGWSPPCPAVGPWRPVWVEQRRLEVVQADVRSRVEGSRGVVHATLELDAGVIAARLLVAGEGQRASAELCLHEGRWTGEAVLDDVRLWWPHTHGDPVRYQVTVEARDAAGTVSIDLGHTGFRTIDIDRTDGDFAIRVNGVDVFCRGACWTPLDVVTLAATPQALCEAVAQACSAGMNMLRVGGTMVYEEAAFHDALDEQGVLLWQDLMFANMDYPEDEAFVAGVQVEVDQQLARLQGRPCLALVCGNSEGEQQAAMGAAPRELWSPRLFHQIIAARVEAAGVAYVSSSAHGGAFPHAANAGTSSYYGVGAYLRPLDDARRSALVFASECLAFANIPDESGLPGGPSLRVHHPEWKARSPRDLGAGWDFDDVRDHYVATLFGIDPAALRVFDHERYLALGRAATAEVMAQAMVEWRRGRSPTRGALIWFLRDLWPGAGWGVIDANGAPKLCFHALRRVLAPTAIALSDEGVNGLAVHVFNDGPAELAAHVRLSLYRGGEIAVGSASVEVQVPAHGSRELAAANWFDGFTDLSFAYRFGPPATDLVHAVLSTGAAEVAEAFWFPVGLPATREADVGLAASVLPGDSVHERRLEISTRRFAQAVTVDVPGFCAEDDGFHLAPGQSRSVRLHAVSPSRSAARASVSALNADAVVRFGIP
ncbi:glycosyl hydrolase 2 galactose-binding domain-containing protein [Dyella sp.]|jgi:beta-mannosidase|uniref:glycosyl hydrolase 2 galactose-binding domain-containing protein n=1 Tax=Dyella sp. TaxID=1869338 RepID=UPI002D794A85|nr:hypothetical protein [Dyella sp.]HET6431952.1 hypothetical protein [Dyella sp.]